MRFRNPIQKKDRDDKGFLTQYKSLLSWCLIFLTIFSTFVVISTVPVAATESSKPDIRFLKIYTEIDNNYAITDIYEMFINPTNNSMDASFSIEIPGKAFISNFSLTIDGIPHYAQIVPKDLARERYDAAVMAGADAAIMEAQGKNVFSYSVSLSPQQRIMMGLRYEQFLEKSIGGYEYIIPLNKGTAHNYINEFSVNIHLSTKQIITGLQVQNYKDSSKIVWDGKNEVNVTYKTSQTAPNVDFGITYQLANPPVNGTMLNYNDGNDEYFFHIFSPQRSDLGGRTMPKEIIFVLDKSGSMQGTKLEQLKTAFEEVINQLPEQDYFNIVMFDSSIMQYKNSLLVANEANKADAVKYIKSFSAGGSTNINDAMTTALGMFQVSETRVPIIVMLTDGLPTQGVTSPSAIRDNIKSTNEAGVAIFSLGFGYDVDFEFLKAMSLENFGFALRIIESEDASEQITNFYETISTPLLKGIRCSYSKGAYEVYPEMISQLFEGSEVVVVGKYNGTSSYISSNIAATSWEGMRTFAESFELEKESNYSFIPRFWAYAKIRYLLDKVTVNGEDEALVANITSLALEFEFVTPYTSLLVEVTQEKPDIKEELDNDNDDTYLNTYDPNLNKPAKTDIPSGKPADDDDGAAELMKSEGDNTILILPICGFVVFIIIIILGSLVAANKSKKNNRK
jgi:uncharacterized protein YegL